MGLDMFLFKAEAPTLNPNIPYDYDYLSQLYDCFNDEDMQSDAMCALKEIAIPYTVRDKKIDLDAVQRCFATGANPHIISIMGDTAKISSDNGIVSVSKDVLEQKCYRPYEHQVWAVHFERVAYWRKEYDLQEMIYDSFEQEGILVENCGFYPLSISQVVTVCQQDPTQAREIMKCEAGTLFYHEWY